MDLLKQCQQWFEQESLPGCRLPSALHPVKTIAGIVSINTYHNLLFHLRQGQVSLISRACNFKAKIHICIYGDILLLEDWKQANHLSDDLAMEFSTNESGDRIFAEGIVIPMTGIENYPYTIL